MFRKVANCFMEGKKVGVVNFFFNEKTGEVTGNVKGIWLSTEVPSDSSISSCVRALYAKYYSECIDRYAVRDTRISKGKASAYVNNTYITVSFDGYVFTEFGDTCEGKPWIGRARYDLIKKYQALEKETSPSCMQVTPEFIKRCQKFLTVTENSLGEPVAIIGNHHVYFARKANVTAPLEYREKTAVMREIDEAFAAVKAEEEVWFEKYE